MATAAFFRVEGPIIKSSSWMAAAWLAANAQGMGERVARLGNLALAAPLAWRRALGGDSSTTRLIWMGLRGMSEDRLISLSEDYYTDYVEPSITEVGRDLIAQAKREAHRVVLISDHIDWIVKPLAEALGADDLMCNRLEMERSRATGRLESPVIGSSVSGQWVREFASENELDLNASVAYGTQTSDSLLLSAIGQACVVRPDAALRRLAKDHDWAVIE